MEKFLKNVLIIFFSMATSNLYAGAFDSSSFSFLLGSSQVSYAENSSKSSTEGSQTTRTTQSGSTSLISLNAGYEAFKTEKYSYYGSATLPMLSSSTDRFFSGGIGVNYYINSLSSVGKYRNAQLSMKIVPKFRYFVGGGIALGYLVYTTQTAKKNDFIFDMNIRGGMIYSLNEYWGLTTRLEVGRGLGVLTTSTTMQIFVGVTMSVED